MQNDTKNCDKIKTMWPNHAYERNASTLFDRAVGQFADKFLFGWCQQEIALPRCFASIVRLQIGLQFFPDFFLRVELSVGCTLVAIDMYSVTWFRSFGNVEWFDGFSTV